MNSLPVHGADLAWAERRYGIPAGDFLDFSSNVNPLGPPVTALRAASEALEHIARYPEPQADGMKAALANFLPADGASLVLGNGSSELIHLLCRTLQPACVAVVTPAFSEYERAAAATGAEILRLNLDYEDGFTLRMQELVQAAATADLVFFCNPASPHGRLYERAALLPVLAACRMHGSRLVVDESFLGFCPPETARSATLLPETGAGNLAVISTLTKLFALAGLRGPGYLVASPKLAARLEEAAPPWRVNVVAAAAGGAALADTEYIARTQTLIPAWRAELRAGLESLQMFDVFSSSANYLLLRLRTGRDAGPLVEALGHGGILVRDCRNFAGLDASFLRVAVRPPAENARLLEELNVSMEAIGRSKG